MADIFLGLDIGGTKCTVSLGSSDAEIIDKISFLTKEPEGPAQAIVNLIASAEELLSKHQASIRAIGISCGSPLDPDKGIIQSPPNLPSWKDVEIVKIFQEKFKVPAFLDNDANAGALAEYSFGAGRGYKNIVFITFGTGCGSGLILDGKIYRGTNCYAGEVGHIRLARGGPVGYRKEGSFEGFCSGGGIAQLAEYLKNDFTGRTILPHKPTAEDVGKAAAQGDALAIKILETSGHYLGKGLAYILDILNPQRVIIGSIFVRCEKFLRPAMEKSLREEALSYTVDVCEIVPAGLGERIGDYAALSIAVYGVTH